MKKPILKFLGFSFLKNPVKLPLYDATVNVRCKTSNGDPKPLLTASIVDFEGNKIRDLTGRVSKENANKTTFPLTMTENDVGKYVQCKSEQGIGFDVVEKRELAIYCGCSKDGSRNLTYCHPKSGQCECYPNYFGMNCDECADGFKDYPDCTGEESKSI